MAGKKFKILIVEDEPDIVEIYGFQLKNHGYGLEAVNDGQAALIWLKKNTPDLVLLDLLIPEVNGYEFLDKIKSYPNRKKMLIYAWSNLTQKKEIDLAIKKGADGFLIKSDYAPTKLAEEVKEILKNKK